MQFSKDTIILIEVKLEYVLQMSVSLLDGGTLKCVSK